MTFKEFLAEVEIRDLRNRHGEAPLISYIASDKAQESDHDMDEYLKYIARMGKKYLSYLNRWNRTTLSAGMLRCLKELSKFLGEIQTLTRENLRVMTKSLRSHLDNANADLEDSNKKVAEIMHWGLVVVDRLHAFGNETPWYGDRYEPNSKPADVRTPF